MAKNRTRDKDGRWELLWSFTNSGQAWLYVVRDRTGEFQGEYIQKVFQNPDRFDRIVREIDVTNQLKRMGLSVVEIVHYDTDNQPYHPYYVTNVYRGGDLRRQIKIGAFANDVEKALGFIEKLWWLLRQVHGTTAHRDLKPENILLSDEGEPVLCDFGLCLPLYEDGARVSATFEQMGSRHYVPREGYGGYRAVVQPIGLDVFAFGKIVYELVSGPTLPGFEEPLGDLDLMVTVSSAPAIRIINHMVAQLTLDDPPDRIAHWWDVPRYIRLARKLIQGSLPPGDPDEKFLTVLLERDELWRQAYHARIARPLLQANLPESDLAGTKVALPTPCDHVIYYPVSIATEAAQSGVYHVFHSQCECGMTYVLSAEPDGVHFRREGPLMAIVDIYENLPWVEHCLEDENGTFYFKEAPSFAVLAEELIKKRAAAEDGPVRPRGSDTR